MACGRPIVLAIDGEARRLAEQEAGSALYVEPENPEALVSAILHLYEHPEIARSLGERGRAFACRRFDRNQLVMELEARIALAVEKNYLTKGASVSAY
jgi:glycosyltransferase involved in cell wall biosynthesis